MTPTHKEKMRWQFAGQAVAGIWSHTPESRVYEMAVKIADNLIAELEKTAPLNPKSEHENCGGEILMTDSPYFKSYCCKCGHVWPEPKLSPAERLTPLVPMEGK